MLDVLAALPVAWQLALAGLCGLLVGSFLNVVILRYPARLKHQWTAQSHEWLHETEYDQPAPPGIVRPASRCTQCQAAIKAWHNIPVISYLLLRGKCASCGVKIHWRYPVVELLTGVLTAWVVFRFGLSMTSAWAVLLTWSLIALSFIDFDHQLLPDDIVLTVLWLGLVLSLIPVFTDPSSAIIGAVLGYLSLWSVYHIFRLITGKEGMGHGDFKLLALFGAWLGWQFLPQIILISTILGSIVGITLMLVKKLGAGTAIPFGPYIALAGWLAMMYGNEINNMYLKSLGLY